MQFHSSCFSYINFAHCSQCISKKKETAQHLLMPSYRLCVSLYHFEIQDPAIPIAPKNNYISTHNEHNKNDIVEMDLRNNFCF